MAEWLFEEGIGEDRAILVDDGGIVEARIELPGTLRAGAVVAGRLTLRGGIGVVETGGSEVVVGPIPRGLADGQAVRVEIVRESLPERGRPKRAEGHLTAEPERAGAPLRDRLGPHRLHRPPDPDRFEAADWPVLIEEARTGEIAFPGGALRMSLTPAMTLFDVDGALPPAELAVAGAAAAARAIRRLGIGGSIGIDLPTVPGKADRQAATAALDSILPQPFERTAVNGFGFLQVVRRRERASLPELIAADPIGAAARTLLRRAEWSKGSGERTIQTAPAVAERLESKPEWLAELARRLGARIALRADPALTTWSGHVHVQQG